MEFVYCTKSMKAHNITQEFKWYAEKKSRVPSIMHGPRTQVRPGKRTQNTESYYKMMIIMMVMVSREYECAHK